MATPSEPVVASPALVEKVAEGWFEFDTAFPLQVANDALTSSLPSYLLDGGAWV